MKVLRLLVLMVSTGLSFGQESPFNHHMIQIESDSSYSFLVGAHFHGASTNLSGFPASTILANLDNMNRLAPDFMICLGDLFLSLNNSKDNYQWSFFDKLNMPLFNAVGNHDVEENNYTQFFGKRYFSFDIGPDVMVILDTEERTGDIKGDQLKFLKSIYSKHPRNVFLFAHRPIWSEEDEKLEDLFKGNTRSGTNYMDDVLPILKKTDAQTYFFGGSLGGESPFSFFYHKKADNLTYLATAVRDLARDGILQIKVVDGRVSITPISLTNKKARDIEFYGLKNWQKTDGSKPFNWRLIPLYMWQMVSHRFFWYGILWTLAGIVALFYMRKWWLKRKGK